MNERIKAHKTEVSVVLPTRDRRKSLQRVLAALARQTMLFDRWEVLVISDGSTDGTNEWLAVQQPPFSMRCVLQTHQGMVMARNNGVARAQGRIVLFMSDDMIPTPELITEHLRLHRQHERAVVLGPTLPPPGGTSPRSPWVRWEGVMLDRQYRSMEAGEWEPMPRLLCPGNISLPKYEILAAGGFDSRFDRAENVEMGYRLVSRGLKLWFNPAAQSLYLGEHSFESWCRTPYAYGCCSLMLARNGGQSQLLPLIANEFLKRSSFFRVLARLCVGHERRRMLAIALLNRVALMGEEVGIRAISHPAYSSIFDLLYYQGMRDELGSTKAFWRLISQHASASPAAVRA